MKCLSFGCSLLLLTALEAQDSQSASSMKNGEMFLLAQTGITQPKSKSYRTYEKKGKGKSTEAIGITQSPSKSHRTYSPSKKGAEGKSTKPKKNQSEPPPLNKAAQPYLEKGSGLYFSGEYLWWKAVQDDLQYVATVCPDRCPDNIILTSYNGSVHEPDFNFEPGFRVGIGYSSRYDGWDLFFNWTKLTSKATDFRCGQTCEQITSARCALEYMPIGSDCQSGACKDCNQSACVCKAKNQCDTCTPARCKSCCDSFLIPTFAPTSTQDQYATTLGASADWRLKLNFLDGELGRQFWVSPMLTFRPFIGARGVWIDQSYDVFYQGSLHIANPAPFEPLNSASIEGCIETCNSFKNDYQGAGPRLGFDTQWNLGLGFSIYALAGISLIWGEFDLEQCSLITLFGELNAEVNNTNLDQQVFCDKATFHLTDDFCSTKAITDLQIGLQWQSNFSKRVAISLFVGWDHHVAFNQNQLIRLQQQLNPFPLAPVVPAPQNPDVFPNLTTTELGLTERRHGDLTLQGLTAGGRFLF